MLTEQQINHFQTFGFLIFRQVFSPDELKTINAEFERTLTEAYRHTPFDGTRRHWVRTMGPDTPFFASLLEDRRFCEPAEQLYGEDVLGIVSDANRYVGDTRWHPDHHADPTEDCYGVKFAYYLESVGAENGALRLIPGSHKNPLHTEVRENLSQLGLEICNVPAYVCESEPGDVVAFDVRCWHASWGGASDRRMCTMVYYHNPDTPEEEAATRRRATNSAKEPENSELPFSIHRAIMSHWVANREGSQKRQRWIDRMRELGFFAPLEI
ncbi:MAG: phytanoyl-CoA dioxygenase family protein [Candidatus Poribacteria bacterium]|nr:phytanoyl-CoA dioxygenase family protein [Candidatus Poribacteria bacterium]